MIPCPYYNYASVMSSYSRLGKTKQTRKYANFISESVAAGVNSNRWAFPP